jgi:UDP-3-O-[3-hydroxymyristoyl] glucosamine N-acyltransferase
MEIPLKDLAALVSGRVHGDGEILIRGVSGIREACPGDITFVANDRYVSLIHETKASAVVLNEKLNVNSLPAILVGNPDMAFARIVSYFGPEPVPFPVGIHPSAVIAQGAKLGREVAVMAHAVIEKGASIGEGTAIYPGVYVGHDAVLGRQCLIYPNVVVRERTRIGNRVIVHSGSVIGCDGFGYSTVQGVHHKIPQIGYVEIEDDVEIGANVTIDRARFNRTLIGKGTKIDNLVQIAHNVVIGQHSCIAGQVGIAGSTRLGSQVVMAGQAGVSGHLEIGDRVIVGARAGVTKDIPAGQCVSGFPAFEHDRQQKLQASLRKVPELQKLVRHLQERIARLEQTAKIHTS